MIQFEDQLSIIILFFIIQKRIILLLLDPFLSFLSDQIFVEPRLCYSHICLEGESSNNLEGMARDNP